MRYLKNIAVRSKQTLLSLGGVCLALSVQAQQVCDPSQFESTPVQNFKVMPLGTVEHLTTNLEWKVCAEGQVWRAGACDNLATYYNWQGALAVPESVNTAGGYAGKSDWRLPNIKELATLIEHRCASPAINEAIFPNVIGEGSGDKRGIYWSSSPSSSNYPFNAWLVEFRTGTVSQRNRTNESTEVRLVRDIPRLD